MSNIAALDRTVTRRHQKSTSVPGAAGGDDEAPGSSVSAMLGSWGTDGGWLVGTNSDGVLGQRRQRRGWLRRPACSVACHCRRPRSLLDGDDGVAVQINSLFDKTLSIS
mgnify:CR=1 FL=1